MCRSCTSIKIPGQCYGLLAPNPAVPAFKTAGFEANGLQESLGMEYMAVWSSMAAATQQVLKHALQSKCPRRTYTC